MSTRTTIRRVSHSVILLALNAHELISAYAAECSLPDAAPQVEMYAAMEQAGALVCFGAYAQLDHPLDDESLVGFVSLLTVVMPHNGKRAATIESLYVQPSHRGTGAADDLLCAAERHAADCECVSLVYTARLGSRLESVLSHRTGCRATHTQFTRTL